MAFCTSREVHTVGMANVIGCAAALLSAIAAAIVWAAVLAGSRADERALRALGCTCAHPRAGQHEGSCPLSGEAL